MVGHCGQRWVQWLDNKYGREFHRQTDQRVNVVYPLVEGSMDPYDRLCWQARNWIENAKTVTQRAKRHDVNITKLNRYLVLENDKFALWFGREVKVQVVDTNVLGQGSYGTIHRCCILGKNHT